MQKWNFYTSKELKPSGWLKRQLELQAQGLSGHLDQIWPDIRDSAWIGGTAEGWERVPYWLDGFIPLAYLLDDKDMIARARRYMDAILARQKESGWICPCDEEKIAEYDTWAVLLIAKVMTVYYDNARDERIPDALYRLMKNYYQLLSQGRIHLFNWGKYRWFEGFIALRFLYDRCGEAWIVDLARLLKEQGMDYEQIANRWERPLYQWTYDTHVVNLAMMLKSEAVSCDLLKTPYKDLAERLYGVLTRFNGTPVDIFTGDECLSGRSPIQGTELCAVAELMYSFELLYACTGDSKWAERLETVAFNALPAAISDDMWAHQYDQMSNQIACQRFPGRPIFRTNDEEAHLFGLEPNYGCCTANFNQAWPKFALSAFLHCQDTVLSAVPVPSALQADGISIALETNYPFENTFVYRIAPGKAFRLMVRIPSFAENLVVNKEPAARQDSLLFSIAEGTFCEIRISYETKPCLVKRPYDLYSAKCGSLVFALPISYTKVPHEYTANGVERKYPYCDYEYIGTSEWQYAYSSSQLEWVKQTLTDVPFSSEQPPVALRAKVRRIPWGLETGFETVCAKTPESRVPTGEEESVLLYPYGCAKLRMTELPLL